MDITEIVGMDNLLAASGVIKEAEDLIAKAYNFKHSLMLTQGSTTSMQMCVYLAKQRGLQIVSFNKMHSSFYNATRLFECGYIEVSDIEKLKDVLQKSAKQVAIFTTSPDYFGNIGSINELNELKGDNLLIVDAAHGAHFPFSSLLPKYPDGDIVFSSMHKTMPAKTSSAIINVNDDALYEELVFIRTLIHSTSPSYLTMASIDLARADFEEHGEGYYSIIKNAIDSLNGEISGFTIEHSDDFSRLVISKENMDGYDLLLQLHDMGIEAEMAYENKVVFILTPFNISDLHRLKSVLLVVKPKTVDGYIKDEEHAHSEGVEGIATFVEINEAEGMYANGDISIYPPSQRIIKRGDKITKEDINILNKHKGHILGLVNNKVPVLK